jgi:hypothetical protein
MIINHWQKIQMNSYLREIKKIWLWMIEYTIKMIKWLKRTIQVINLINTHLEIQTKSRNKRSMTRKINKVILNNKKRMTKNWKLCTMIMEFKTIIIVAVKKMVIVMKKRAKIKVKAVKLINRICNSFHRTKIMPALIQIIKKSSNQINLKIIKQKMKPCLKKWS